MNCSNTNAPFSFPDNMKHYITIIILLLVDVGNIKGSFLMNDTALLICHTWFGVFGNHVDAFHQYRMVLSVD